jgi:hypothetical protein
VSAAVRGRNFRTLIRPSATFSRSTREKDLDAWFSPETGRSNLAVLFGKHDPWWSNGLQPVDGAKRRGCRAHHDHGEFRAPPASGNPMCVNP